MYVGCRMFTIVRISVVIPCHNSAGTIEAALDSVAEQIQPASEVIVVNDRSHDNTWYLAHAHPLTDSVFDVNFGNAAASRNAGVARATGDWIAFLDADNQWTPEHLAAARALLETCDDGVFCSPPAEATNVPPVKAERRVGHPLADPTSGLTQETFVDWRYRYGWGFPTTGLVIERGLFKTIGGFDESQVRRHDFELVMRAITRKTWSATPYATWWSRPPRSGDISSDEARCAYYAFRALKRNRSAYDDPRFQRMLRRSAMLAAKLTLLDGDSVLISDTSSIIHDELSLPDRIKITAFSLLPLTARRALASRMSGNVS